MVDDVFTREIDLDDARQFEQRLDSIMGRLNWVECFLLSVVWPSTGGERVSWCCDVRTTPIIIMLLTLLVPVATAPESAEPEPVEQPIEDEEPRVYHFPLSQKVRDNLQYGSCDCNSTLEALE